MVLVAAAALMQNSYIFQNWTERWTRTIETIGKVAFSPGDCRLELKPAASLAEVKAVEDELGFRLPESLKEVICNFSSSLDFFWFLRDFSFPAPLDFIGHGICEWDLEDLPAFEKDRLRWLALSGGDSAWEIFRDKLYFLFVGNGDRIAIDLSKTSDGEVIYLACHFEDEPGHGYVLGENFIDFIDRWTQIGCVGSEIWQIIEFTNSPTSYIDPKSEISVRWRQTLGL